MLHTRALLLFYTAVSTHGSFTDPEGDGRVSQNDQDRAMPKEKTEHDYATTTAHTVGDDIGQSEANNNVHADIKNTVQTFSLKKNTNVATQDESVAGKRRHIPSIYRDSSTTSGVDVRIPIGDSSLYAISVRDDVAQREVARVTNTDQVSSLKRKMHVDWSDDNATGKRLHLAPIDRDSSTASTELFSVRIGDPSTDADDIGQRETDDDNIPNEAQIAGGTTTSQTSLLKREMHVGKAEDNAAGKHPHIVSMDRDSGAAFKTPSGDSSAYASSVTGKSPIAAPTGTHSSVADASSPGSSGYAGLSDAAYWPLGEDCDIDPDSCITSIDWDAFPLSVNSADIRSTGNPNQPEAPNALPSAAVVSSETENSLKTVGLLGTVGTTAGHATSTDAGAFGHLVSSGTIHHSANVDLDEDYDRMSDDEWIDRHLFDVHSMSKYSTDPSLSYAPNQPTAPRANSGETVIAFGTVGPSGTVTTAAGHATPTGACGLSGTICWLVALSSLTSGNYLQPATQIGGAAYNLPAITVGLSRVGGSSQNIISSAATSQSGAAGNPEHAESSRGTASLPTAGAFTSFRDTEHFGSDKSSEDEISESSGSPIDATSLATPNAFTSYRDVDPRTCTLSSDDSDELSDDSGGAWPPAEPDDQSASTADKAPGDAHSLQTVDLTVAASSSAVASELGTASTLAGAAPQSRRITFVPTLETAIKPMDQLIRENGRVMGKAWNNIQTVVVIDEFVVFKDTISGNEKDHNKTEYKNKKFRKYYQKRSSIGSQKGNDWKFFLQALELPPLSGHAFVWIDFENRIFSIEQDHMDIICEWYQKYIEDNGDNQSTQTPHSLRKKIRNGIYRLQHHVIDQRPILTPLLPYTHTVTIGRHKFQFGRHLNMELYRQYLVDARKAMESGAN